MPLNDTEEDDYVHYPPYVLAAGSNLQVLEDTVNDLLRRGYHFQGNMVFDSNEYVQPMFNLKILNDQQMKAYGMDH